MTERTPTSRRLALGALLALGAALGGYLLWGPSDQRRVLATTRELLASVNSLPGDTDAQRRRRVQSALERFALPDVSLSVPELGVVEGRAALLALLEDADGIGLDVRIEQSDVRVARESASATLLVAISTTTLGERRREVRTVSVELGRLSDAFVVLRIAASAPSREQPEARP